MSHESLIAGGVTAQPSAMSGDSDPIGPTGRCLNCGSVLTGAFCGVCGQRDVPPYPSLRELALDAFQELSGWDGRLATTLRTLLVRPGMLTREFLEGRRARYISPLRLYLAASLAYFVIAAASPNVTLDSGKTVFFGIRGGASASAASGTRPMRVGESASEAMRTQEALTAAARDEILRDIASAPALMQPFLRRAIEDPAGLQRGLMETMPRMLFVLLPIFAAIVALLYRGRRYPEHLYFAIHLHAFIFSALLAIELLKFTGATALVITGAVAVLLTIPVYAVVAFRRVYGETLTRALAKGVVIAAAYAVVAFSAFAGTLYWLSITA